MGKVIGVVSVKGGVGKTSSVVSLGHALSGIKKRVLLVDGNLSSPNLGIHLKIIDPEVSLHHVLSRMANIGDSIHKLADFDVIPSTIFNNLKTNPFELKDKIKPLKRRYDFILIDSSPALNSETLAVFFAADEIVIVTTPDVPTLSATLKTIKMAKKRKIPIMGMVLNKVYDEKFELSIDDIEKTTGVPVLAVVPYDKHVLKALSEFTPYTDYKPKSKGSVEFKKLAGVLAGQKYKPFSLRNTFGLTPKRQEINREIFYDRVFG
ncbi:MAG: AAA family ATPase [archaeon]